MPDHPIRFENGAAYARFMGHWSQLAGEVFIDWLQPATGLRWLDVGCGNGAFTELLVARCAPRSVHGIDPSEAQLAFATAQATLSQVQFSLGDAMALPYLEHSFDIAVMPLVIFFVPEPAKGVAEMRRVVCPGGWVTAYAWDMHGGGFPYAALQAQVRGMGLSVPAPPSVEASRPEVMQRLWADAGLESIELTEISVQRTFADFDDYWTTILGGPSVAALLASMSVDETALLKTQLSACLPTDASGRISCSARAHAIRGRVSQ